MKIFIAALLLFVSSIAFAVDTPGQLPSDGWYPGKVGQFYTWVCEDILDGTYVMSEPNFLQTWACEDGHWCNVFPDMFGCPQITPYNR